ncbi:MAG: hypothetical protein ACO3J5_07570 [Pseudohongiellaceae bacterium]
MKKRGRCVGKECKKLKKAQNNRRIIEGQSKNNRRTSEEEAKNKREKAQELRNHVRSPQWDTELARDCLAEAIT